MKILRTAASIGIAKKLYDEARKPQNQARIKAGVGKLRNRGGGQRAKR
ncbi:hypothetical protein JK386_17875 [Nocardioides sp. zg-536]|uniref:Uncharacterized protein n=1 Tax=Nocardioides faecalis TaxID=2803858 RepID=A0A938YDA4_9ACTN|nr:hypothetical protein [Nocardioides faecalis]MBM9461764.1 hypothetical protein [Nocardioides faecalis]QVI58963.1 hypothetical protein KG111_00745 [Nocardioides faecalis]